MVLETRRSLIRRTGKASVVARAVPILGFYRDILVEGVLESSGQIRDAVVVRVEAERNGDTVIRRIARSQRNDLVVQRRASVGPRLKCDEAG